MANKHYQEQKMLIENFRKWRDQCEEEPPVLQEGLGDILQYLTISAATLYTIGPYLKIAVHHPAVQSVLTGNDSESGTVFRAMALGLKGADNAGQWLQDYADELFSKDVGTIDKLKNAIVLFVFLAVLATTAFPIIGSMLVRALPKISLFISKTTKSARKKSAQLKAKIKGEPKPEQIEMMDQEIDELEDLELQKQEAQKTAAAVAEVVEMIKQDPQKFATELGVELSPEDLKNMKIDPERDQEQPVRKSNRMKFDVPPSEKSTSARRASIGDRVVGGLKDR